MTRTQHPFRMFLPLRASVGATALVLSALAGCASHDTTQLGGSDAVLMGNVSLSLTTSDGTTLDVVAYRIESAAGTEVAAGDIRVTDPAAEIAARIGLPAGVGYSVSLSATTADGDSCAGSASFDVVAGQAAFVVVDLSCGVAAVGEAVIQGQIQGGAACVALEYYSAAPLRASVGGQVELAASARAAGAVSYHWSSSSGTLAEPDQAATTFSCTEPGVATLTLHAHGSEDCEQEVSLEVTCVGAGPANVPGRLLVADRDAPALRVIDPNLGSVLATFELASPASLYTTESGRFVAAVQSDANRVDFVDSGLEVEDHGDHVHENELTPARSALSLVGEELGTVGPVHFISHHGWITQHFDGLFDAALPEANIPAKNVVFAEFQLLSAAPMTQLVLESAPQHGVSVATGDGYLIFSQPSLDRAQSTLPSGFGVHSLEDGVLVQTLHDGDDFQSSCWGMHGEAVVGDRYLFGCHESLDGGLLVIEPGAAAGEFVSRKIEYPGFPAAERRTSVIQAHPSSPWAVGQWGSFPGTNEYRGLVRIDPSANRIEEADTIDLGEVYCSFGFERSSGREVAVLTQDGLLRVIDVPSWQVTQTARVLPDTSALEACPGAMTVGEGVAFLSEPESGLVTVVPLDDLSNARSFSVPGAPGSLAVTGFWGIIGVP